MKIYCADLFCGGGGTSEGLVEAATELGLEVDLVAINHWPTAIETHSKNHPRARHICARLEEVRPREVVKGGRLHLLVASPECTHHSNARGGRPVDDQKRVPAWGVIHWLQELYVDNVIIENVLEFRSWGPIGANGKALKSRKGETYKAFLQALRSLGYQVDERMVCCADYGDATIRKRLFIMCTRRGQPTWPQPTHSQEGDSTLFSTTQSWRAAREIIDWDLPGQSIFGRKKALAPKTLKRIAAGMRRFNNIDLMPYLVMLYGTNFARSIQQPLPTVTAGGGHIGLAQPFVISIDHAGGNGSYASSTDQPITTITSKARHGLVAPFMVGAGGPERAGDPREITKPLNTVLTRQSMALIEPQIVEGSPFLISAGGPEGKGRRPKSVDQPLSTILTENHDGLVQPFVVVVNHGDKNSTSRESHKSADAGSEVRCHSVDGPLPTVTCSNGYAVVNPYITKYNGTATAQAVTEPLDTVTTRDRFALVEPEIIGETETGPAQTAPLIPLGDGKYLDIRFRMLQWHELAAAQGFPERYSFAGNNSAKVRQIGNAVPRFTAKALCKERLKRYSALPASVPESSSIPVA